MLKSPSNIDQIQLIEKICKSSDENSNLAQSSKENLRKYLKDLIDSDNIKKAEIIISELEKRGKSRDVSETLSEFSGVISKGFKKQGNIHESLTWAKKSLIFIKEIYPNSEKTSKCLLNLALILSIQGETRKSIKKLTESLQILKKLLKTTGSVRIKKLFAVTLFNLAVEEEKIGDFLEAEIKYKEILVFLNEFKRIESTELLAAVKKSIERVQKHLAKTKTSLNLTLNYSQGSIKSFSNINQSKLSKTKLLKQYSKKSSSKPEDITQITQSRSRNSMSKSFISCSPSIEYICSSASVKSRKNFNEIKNLKSIKPKFKDFPNLQLPSLENKKNIQNKEKLKNPIFQSNLSPELLNKDKTLGDNSTCDNKKANLAEKEKIGEGNQEFALKGHLRNEITGLIGNLFKFKEVKHVPMPSQRKIPNTQDHKNPEKHHSESTRSRVLIQRSRVDFNMKFLEVSYFFKSSQYILEVQCKDMDQCWLSTFDLPSNQSAFEFITKYLEPRLSLLNNNLILEDCCELQLVEGSFMKEKSSGTISIVRFYPRWKVQVTINEKSECFEMAEIKPNFPSSVDLAKDHPFLLTLFSVEKTRIQVNLGISYPLEVIFDGSIENRFMLNPVQIYIQRLSHPSFYSYLIKGKNSDLASLIVDSCIIGKRIDRLRPTLNETINFFKKNVLIEGGKLKLNENDDKIDEIIKKRSKVQRKSIMLNKNLEISQKLGKTEEIQENFNFFNIFSGVAEAEPELKLFRSNTEKVFLHESFVRSENLENTFEYSQLMMKGSEVEEIDYHDRIILRTCICRNNQIYQISMSLANDEVLKFYIRKGSNVENLNLFSIKLDLLSEKTGISKDFIIPLGSFVLRNLLVIKDSNICYFDFSQSIEAPLKAFDKLSSLFKGFMVRRKLKLKLKQLVGKKKVKLQGLVYTALVYLGNDAIYLRFVRIAEVLALDLSLNMIVKDGLFVNVEVFFSNMKKVGIMVLDLEGQKKIVANEKYLAG